MKKILTTVGIAALVVVWLALTAAAWFGNAPEILLSERRKPAKAPELSIETLMAEDDYNDDGSIKRRNSFMSKFEAYSLDKFPLRDRFRQVKSMFTYYVMQQKDNNNIYVEDGVAATMIYPLEQGKVDINLKVLNTVLMRNLMQGKCNVYVSVIPDKGYFLAEDNGYLSIDYDNLIGQVQGKWPAEKFPKVHYVDITDVLTIEDYYRTDTHWRQEEILPVANKLAEAMGVTVLQEGEYTKELIDRPFYGVYYGQAALPMDPEPMYLMRSELLDNCRVSIYDGETWTESTIYNMEKVQGYDLYEVFLSGNMPLVQIENPNAATQKELIVFRDSFGSSLAPLLVKDYAKVTLVDLRLIDYDTLTNYITFQGQDVLYLYNTQVLNSSLSKKAPN